MEVKSMRIRTRLIVMLTPVVVVFLVPVARVVPGELGRGGEGLEALGLLGAEKRGAGRGA